MYFYSISVTWVCVFVGGPHIYNPDLVRLSRVYLHTTFGDLLLFISLL